MISIVSDSSTLYSVEQGKQIGLSIVPLNITVDDVSYRDFEDISEEKIYQMIEEGKVPRTSQPSLGEKIDLYNELSKKGEVIDITIASGLSGTYSTALLAKEACDNPDKIHVVDSMTLCGPQRYMVDKALEMAALNKSSEEIISKLEEIRETDCSFLIPVDFAFLVRGGRLNGVAGILGGMLKLIALMKKGDKGKGIDKFSISKTSRKAAFDMIEEMKKENVDSSYVFYITHSQNIKLATKMKEKLLEAFPEAEIHFYPLSPSFITQTGPGSIAVQAIKKF